MSQDLLFSSNYVNRDSNNSSSSKFSDYMMGLQDATPFELYRIREAILNLLEDPSRQIAIKRFLRVGETVSYFQSAENRCVDAVVLKINRTLALVQNIEDGSRWKIPFYMINLDQSSVGISEPNRKGLSRNELSVGATVGFHDRNEQKRYGTIVKLNPKTAKVRCDDNGSVWRVSYSFLFPVIDGQSRSKNPNVLDALSVKAIPKPR